MKFRALKILDHLAYAYFPDKVAALEHYGVEETQVHYCKWFGLV